MIPKRHMQDSVLNAISRRSNVSVSEQFGSFDVDTMRRMRIVCSYTDVEQWRSRCPG